MGKRVNVFICMCDSANVFVYTCTCICVSLALVPCLGPPIPMPIGRANQWSLVMPTSGHWLCQPVLIGYASQWSLVVPTSAHWSCQPVLIGCVSQCSLVAPTSAHWLCLLPLASFWVCMHLRVLAHSLGAMPRPANTSGPAHGMKPPAAFCVCGCTYICVC